MERTTVGYDKLRRYMQRMFEVGLKYPEESAEITAKVLVEADARGHASHGTEKISRRQNPRSCTRRRSPW